MPTLEQKKKFLKAKIAVALHDELGPGPKDRRNRVDVPLVVVCKHAIVSKRESPRLCMCWGSRLEVIHQLPLYHFESLILSLYNNN